jgi:hypothetical protein
VRHKPGIVDDVLAHGLPVALQLLGGRLEKEPPKHIDVAAECGGARVLVGFGNHTDMRSMAAWLRRLQPTSVLCVIRDAQRPISSGAKATMRYLEAINQAGGRFVRVETEALAALDAMRRLLSLATSGDLSLRGQTIPDQTVRDWLARNLPQEITKFAEEVLGGEACPPDNMDILLELLGNHKILSLEEAARLTELPQQRIENYARMHPDRIGFFGGACPVVCLAVSPSAQGAANATR